MNDTTNSTIASFRDELSGIEVESLVIGLYLGKVSTIIEVFGVRCYHLKLLVNIEEAAKHSFVVHTYRGIVSICFNEEII